VGLEEHCPPLCEAITCSDPVYVLVFTCRLAPGKQEPPGASHPARPRWRSRFAPFPQPEQHSDPLRPVALPLELLGYLTVRVLSESTCVRVPGACVGLCARVYVGPSV
jgi:hypothetical protein